jgi:hypothetical protein
MFSTRVTTSASFLRMPASTQALYFHLGMHADDDGVVEAFKIVRMVGSADDDLKMLSAKGFVKVLNEDLVTFITDWREHNIIRADRKVDSIYKQLLLLQNTDVELLPAQKRADTKEFAGGRPKDCIRQVKLSKDKIIQEQHPFEDFWSIYPKKVERLKSEHKWSYLTYKTRGEILEDIPRRKLGKQWLAGFIPNPMTYLNGERWKDEIEPAVTKSKSLILQQ